jgi:molybdate transport system ATP-binding protein
MLIRLEHVNVALNGKPVLRDVTWTLNRGEHWAILGENGAGKSTFLRLIRGEVWPAPTNGGKRIYCFDGEETESPIGAKKHISFVSAEQQTRYMRTDWHMRAWQVVYTGLFDSDLIYQHPTTDQLTLVDDAMERLQISELRESFFHTLSQGQLRKVLIARALIRKPDILICDEIGVGLDQSARNNLYDEVERMTDCGTQILMTSHRTEELIPSITHEMEIRSGRIRTLGSRVQKTEVGISNSEDRRRAQRSQDVERSSSSHQPAFLIDIANANVALDDGAKVVLRNVNWRMNEGEHWLIVGDNGAGKSTLLKLILGDLHVAHGGHIHRFNTSEFRDVWEIKKKIGYVGTDLQTRYHHDLTARQVIGTGFNASIGWLSKLTRNEMKRVDEVIEILAIQELADRSIQRMSFGQVRKVLVARALVNQPQMLILDEVFDGLDANFRAELSNLFEKLSNQVGIVLVSHHKADMLSCITHALEIRGGEIVSQGKLR